MLCRGLSSPQHTSKLKGAKISQRAQCMAIEKWLCLLCVVEKCHEQSIVPYEMGYRLGRAIVLFQFAWISSVACWLLATPFWLLTNSICTRDTTSSHEADGNKPSIITSNKQDAINCLPHQLKFVPWYSARNLINRFNDLTYLMPVRRDELSGREQITGWSLRCSTEARLIHNYRQLIHLYCSATITTCDYRQLKWKQASWALFKETS